MPQSADHVFLIVLNLLPRMASQSQRDLIAEEIRQREPPVSERLPAGEQELLRLVQHDRGVLFEMANSKPGAWLWDSHHCRNRNALLRFASHVLEKAMANI